MVMLSRGGSEEKEVSVWAYSPPLSCPSLSLPFLPLPFWRPGCKRMSAIF